MQLKLALQNPGRFFWKSSQNLDSIQKFRRDADVHSLSRQKRFVQNRRKRFFETIKDFTN